MRAPAAAGCIVAEPLRVASAYTGVLEAQRVALIDALAPVVTPAAEAAAQRDSARLSVRLDASPLQDATADAVDRGEVPVSAAPAQRNGGGWATALRLDGMPTQDIAAIEYRGVLAAQAAETALAGGFFADPIGTLRALQRHIAAGLVDDDRLGTLRRTSRAVHDGAQGRAIFHAPPPERLPALLTDLDAWLRAAAGRHAPLEVAGVVHARVLHLRPFEAGNGRVARAASRVALRASGGDPWGLAVPERIYVAEPLRYVTEVAATIRRGHDLRPWNERTGEAVVTSLEVAARELGATAPAVDARSLDACDRLAPGDPVTVPQLAALGGMGRDEALAQANLLCWCGVLDRDLGTHGLRYRRTPRHMSDGSGEDRGK
jgi:hypothetical protein